MTRRPTGPVTDHVGLYQSVGERVIAEQQRPYSDFTKQLADFREGRPLDVPVHMLPDGVSGRVRLVSRDQADDAYWRRQARDGRRRAVITPDDGVRFYDDDGRLWIAENRALRAALSNR